MQVVTRSPKAWRENSECIQALHDHQKAAGLKGYVIEGEAIATWFVRGQYALRAARGVASQGPELEPEAPATTSQESSALDEWARIKAARAQLVSKLEAEIASLERQIEERRSALREIKES